MMACVGAPVKPRWVIRALVKIGPEAKAAVPELEAIPKDDTETEFLHDLADKALEKINGKSSLQADNN